MRRFLVATAAYRMLREGVISHSMRMVVERAARWRGICSEAVLGSFCVVGGRDPREVKADTWHDWY